MSGLTLALSKGRIFEETLPLLAAALLGALAASCASKPSHFYTLESVAAATDGPAAPYSVTITST